VQAQRQEEAPKNAKQELSNKKHKEDAQSPKRALPKPKNLSTKLDKALAN
jgi:hypothetical protein